jgi:hypothetical protein
MNNQTDNQNLIKLGICSILLYLNIGSNLSIISSVLNIILSFFKISYIGQLAVNVATILCSFALTIGIFVYFLRHLEFISSNKSLNKLVLINLIVYPLAFIFSVGLSLLRTFLFSKYYDVLFVGQYFSYLSIISGVGGVLNAFILTAFGIAALGKKLKI